MFTPTHEEVAAARAIVAAADEAGGRIVRVAEQMVGPPMVQAARALLSRVDGRTPRGATA
ncbi:hypothetical protein [Streptomyces tailanensis]|uniref:hypothetical protein n=1 Tax=Streptomyces tailanensis TaxID=2569858 RepID=UPI001FE93679|nr:hypothetical protein [Streptomyces tailanensis]